MDRKGLVCILLFCGISILFAVSLTPTQSNAFITLKDLVNDTLVAKTFLPGVAIDGAFYSKFMMEPSKFFYNISLHIHF